jgi:hypothetical protein
MNQDPLLQLLDSSLTFDTGSLLRDIGLFAMVSPNSAQDVLDRFMVQGLTHCKDVQVQPWAPTGMNPQHEFIVIELEDTKQTSSKPLFVVLERTASSSGALQPSPAQSSLALVMAAPLLASASMSSLSESLLPSDSLSPYKAVATDEFELTPPSPQASPSTQLSCLDSASLVATRTLHASTQSTSSVRLAADDRFVGSKNLGAYANSTLNIKQVRPQSLSLFELVVLADAVHNHDPHYSTLRHQCFWFATTLCDVVLKKYSCHMVTGSAPSLSRDEVCNSYLPDLEGRWMGFLISRVEDTFVTTMASYFQNYLQEKKNEVYFIFYQECHLLNPDKDNIKMGRVSCNGRSFEEKGSPLGSNHPSQQPSS